MSAERYWEQRWRDEEARNAKLVAELAKSCDDGRFEDLDWACPRAVKAEDRNAKLEATLSWIEDYEPGLVQDARERFNLNEVPPHD